MTNFLHVSCEIVRLPMMPGVDTKPWDDAVARGQIRDAKPLTLANGEVIRVGRTKGVTYRRSLPKIRHGQGRLRRMGALMGSLT